MSWTSFFKGIGEGISRTETAVDKISSRIEHKVYRLKKKMILASLQISFLTLGVLFIIGGAIIFFRRFFSTDLVLFGLGIILLYFALLAGWKK